ncbi:MAG: hypothetical protein ACKOKG_12735 [Verrucomicrobiota bacterium]
MTPTPLQGLLAGLAVALLWTGAWYWFRTRLRYVIGKTSLRVVLGKTTVRRVPFEEIRRIRKPRGSLSWRLTENWRNGFFDSHRVLVLERNVGWFPWFVITPSRRYEFRTQLREAMARHGVETDDEDPAESAE